MYYGATFVKCTYIRITQQFIVLGIPLTAIFPRAASHKEGKGKDHPKTDHKGPQKEQRCSSTLSLTSALHWVGG
jgi:hypothetical protein